MESKYKKNEAAFLTNLSLWPKLTYLLLHSILMGVVESQLPEAFLESPEWKHSHFLSQVYGGSCSHLWAP